MTLADVLTALDARGALTRHRVKDMKTSIKYLAAALGHASPEQCPVDAACREEATWATALETTCHAGDPGPDDQRGTPGATPAIISAYVL